MYPHFRSWRRTGQGGKETRPEQRFGEDLLAKTRVNRVSEGKEVHEAKRLGDVK